MTNFVLHYLQIIFFFCFLTALFWIAVLVISEKIGIVEKYQLKRPRWMPQACNFCFFFWGSLFSSITLLCLVAPGQHFFIDLSEAVLSALLSAAWAAVLYRP